MEEALTEHLKTLYGSLGCTKDHQVDDRNSQGVEESVVQGSPEEGAPKWEICRISLDRAFPRLRAHTAPGPDGIPARLSALYKNRKSIASLFNDIFAGVDIPADWQRGRVALILRRGGKAGNLQDYRPLTVTSTMYRLFTQVLKG
ncbi:uncharacterized protein LOC119176976 [Rhipicephalus microplus]|uniref:uncharacterized protein LOC119176976 n=1 Tax=Rhipicephalus microplus TaxID=6941 RepID=UPI001886BB0A|nr:uncharacterized protein LOC119176976 [Rhipicephalus microplus]